MAKLLSDRDAERLGPALNAIESMTQKKNRTSRRRVRTKSSGGSIRSWVVIDSVINDNTYTGTVYEGPGGDVIEEGVSIVAKNGIINAFEEGDEGFADKTTINSEDVYYVEAFYLS